MAMQNGHNNASILDIRHGGFEHSILDDLREKLNPGKGQERRMPTLLLYDDQGLKLFEDITYLDEYYLTNAEIKVLQDHADRIASFIQPGSQVVELGSGNLRKVSILLKALEKSEKNVDYFALDLSLSELDRTLSEDKTAYKHVHCHGLLGTYDDALAWLKKAENVTRPKCILWMGSSIGNLNRTEAAEFLKDFADILRGQDTMLIGVDACQDKTKVYHAYNDKEGKTHDFVLNGLDHANRLMGYDVFKKGDWKVIGEYDEEAHRHQAFYSPMHDVVLEGTVVRAGEKIRIEESYKYSSQQSDELWQAAGLIQRAKFGDNASQYYLHVVSAPNFSYPLEAEHYAAQPVPSLNEFEQLWVAWDVVTKHMIPKQELLSKPINLRNCCIFYLGHVPAFLDMHLMRATAGPKTQPGEYQMMFERGIDPDVENPENCHVHSEIPDEWPPTEEILDYQERVRARARALYQEKTFAEDRKLGRAMWIGFEHEAMHLETLLYMLLQSDKTVPPQGLAPDFATLSKQARNAAIPNEWINIPAHKLIVGMDDLENDLGPDRFFGWDNEKPRREIESSSFEAQARPLTNEDYARFLEQTHQDKLPASWASDARHIPSARTDWSLLVNGSGAYMNGLSPPLTDAFLEGKYVRTVYGLIPLKYGLDWPVFASFDELAACAEWMGGRIPTVLEAKSIYSYADIMKTKEADSILTRKISAVNGHLSNDGVEISPPSHHSHKGAFGAEQTPDPHELFVDLEGCNVGFKQFHPMPVTQNGNRLSGQGDMGGVWEWTSSVLERHEGFVPMELYPAYTDDFFDGKHNIVLGGSWATHPRIAGRKSFVNFYQRNYPYAWCGARLVRDAKQAENRS